MKTSHLLALLFASCPALLRAQAIEVTSSGVGVGTASPAAKLHVYGSGNPGPDSSNVPFIVEDPTGTSGQNKWGIGTRIGTNSIALQDLTNNATRFYIDGNGNVGIGTINLSIAGGYTPRLHIAAPYASIALEATTPGKKWGFGVDSNGALDIFESTSGYSGRLLITNAGNVGIGTGSPTRQLSIYNQYAAAVLKSTASSGGTGGSTLYFGNSASDSAGWLNYDHTTNSLAVRVNEAERLHIDSSGNIGIGTASPGYKLEVSGSVRATSFISNSTTYADFVFKPGYRLTPLAEVESAIKAKGHLPDIPGEAEAKAHGVDLGEMQVKLLQKVEELTLYLVAHEKELQRLTAENAALQRKVSELARH